MGDAVVSPLKSPVATREEKEGGEGDWVFSSPPQLRFSVGITRENRVPLLPQSPVGPIPVVGRVSARERCAPLLGPFLT